MSSRLSVVVTKQHGRQVDDDFIHQARLYELAGNLWSTFNPDLLAQSTKAQPALALESATGFESSGLVVKEP